MDDVDDADPAIGEAASFDRLIERVAKSHDRGAFRALFDHFAPRIKAYLLRIGCDAGQAEELAQEVMVTVWRRAETFDSGQARAATWIFTIARNKRVDAIRRERRPEIDPNDPMLVREPEPDADAVVTAGQEAEMVRQAMQDLPEEQKDLLHRAYFEDQPHGAIAEATGLPLGTVKSRLRLALNRLRKTLKEA
jgi:RNA polymerase sigma-70 factor (ECF subfamily)